jgi:hypothetical protein
LTPPPRLQLPPTLSAAFFQLAPAHSSPLYEADTRPQLQPSRATPFLLFIFEYADVGRSRHISFTIAFLRHSSPVFFDISLRCLELPIFIRCFQLPPADEAMM